MSDHTALRARLDEWIAKHGPWQEVSDSAVRPALSDETLRALAQGYIDIDNDEVIVRAVAFARAVLARQQEAK